MRSSLPLNTFPFSFLTSRTDRGILARCWDGTIDDSTPSINYTPTVGTVPPFLASLGAQARQAEAESSAGLPTLSIWRVWGALFGVLALTVVLRL